MAQADYFLKIEGLKGESTDSKHKEEIELESFSWGARNGTTIGSATGGAGAGKGVGLEFVITKRADRTSPMFYLACTSGTHFKEAFLTCRKAGGEQQEYFKAKFTTVFTTNYQTHGETGAGGLVLETITMVYGALEIIYKEQKPDGSLGGEVKQGWNFVTNKKI